MKIEDAFTTLRIILAPVVMALIFSGDMVTALYVYIIAAITDAFDGYFARKNKRKSNGGEVFDSIADFTLVYFAAFALSMVNEWRWLSMLMLFSAAIIISLMWVISKKKKELSIPHLRSAKVLAWFVHPTIIAYIAGWEHATTLLLLGIAVGLYTAADYALYAIKQKSL